MGFVELLPPESSDSTENKPNRVKAFFAHLINNPFTRKYATPILIAIGLVAGVGIPTASVGGYRWFEGYNLEIANASLYDANDVINAHLHQEVEGADIQYYSKLNPRQFKLLVNSWAWEDDQKKEVETMLTNLDPMIEAKSAKIGTPEFSVSIDRAGMQDLSKFAADYGQFDLTPRQKGWKAVGVYWGNIDINTTWGGGPKEKTSLQVMFTVMPQSDKAGDYTVQMRLLSFLGAAVPTPTPLPPLPGSLNNMGK